MSEIKDKVKEELYNKLVDCCFEQLGTSDKAIREFIDDEILSIPELAIVDREANREFYDALHKVEVEIPKGWVKEVKANGG